MKELFIRPISLREANLWVSQFHRHNKRTNRGGGKCAISAVNKDNKTVGVAILGRPIARLNDDNRTLEITRVVTDGTKNANSFLYAACWRVAQALGYSKVLTYTLKTESGSSLKALGWIQSEVHGHGWSWKDRLRKAQKISTQDKYKWEMAIK